MSFENVMGNIKMLSCSQGFYGRLYYGILWAKDNDPEAYDDFVAEIEAQNFGDIVDMVTYFEC